MISANNITIRLNQYVLYSQACYFGKVVAIVSNPRFECVVLENVNTHVIDMCNPTLIYVLSKKEACLKLLEL